MGSTKIFVIQLREVFKSAIYVIIGIILLALLAYFFIPKTNNNVTEPSVQASSDALYIPGIYAIELTLSNAKVNLEIEVTENEIISVRFSEPDERQQAFYPLLYPAMRHLSSEVIRTQSSEIAITSDYEFTNRVLLDAIRVALSSAQASQEE